MDYLINPDISLTHETSSITTFIYWGNWDLERFSNMSSFFGSSLVAQMVKNLPARQETQVWYQAWEDPLEKEMATYTNILAWEIPWIEELGGLSSTGLQRVGRDWTYMENELKNFC